MELEIEVSHLQYEFREFLLHRRFLGRRECGCVSTREQIDADVLAMIEIQKEYYKKRGYFYAPGEDELKEHQMNGGKNW